MKIKQITVTAGRTVPHPRFDYGNVKADLQYVADLEGGEDPETARRELQSKAESDIENHVAELREAIVDHEGYQRRTNRIKELEKQIDELKEQQSKGGQQLLISDDL